MSFAIVPKLTFMSRKHLRTSYDKEKYRNGDSFVAYTDHYRYALIKVEREVDLQSLSQTCIPTVFRDGA